MKKFSLLLFCCLLTQLGWSQNLTIVDFTGFTSSNLSTISPGWSEAEGPFVPSGTTSSWVRDDFANLGANGDAAKINLYNLGDQDWIVSPVFLANANSELKFDLALTDFASTTASVLGSDDSLEIRTSIDNGVTWQPLFTWTAASPAISNTGQAEAFSLAAFAGQNMQIAFYATEGAVDDPEDNDVFIDNIEILNPLATDLSMTQILSPSGASCFGSMETITVEIQNTGTGPLDFAANNTPVGVDVTGAATANYSTTLSTGTLAPDSTMMVTVTTMADFSAAGVYSLAGHVTYPGDPGPGNDTATSSLSGLPVLAAPLTEDFETGVAGSPGTLPSGWTLSSQDAFQWYVETDGATNSSNTGPLDDHTPGGMTYVYTEATSGAIGSVTELTSPCIDLSALVSPRMGFWYHMYGAQMGDLKIDVIANGVRTTVDSLIGQQQTSETAPWEEKIVNLTGYTGQTIQVVFVGTKGTTFRSDMAVDDISFFDPLADDVAVANGSLVFGCSNASTATVSMEVSNFGIQPASGLMASFSVDGGANSTPEMIPGTLAPGATITYTFTNTADVSVPGPHVIATGVFYAADLDNSNNIDTFDIANNLSFITAPFLEDFETATSGSPGTFPTGWTISSTSSATAASAGWHVETDGTTNSSDTGPLDDHTPGGSQYVFTETSSGALGDLFSLTTPCVDLAGLTSPRLSFWYHMYGADMGALRVWVSIGGVVTQLDSIIGQQQTAETDPWLERVVDLSTYQGQTIQLIFEAERGASFTSDLSLDDIQIFQPPASDLAVLGTDLGSSACGLDSSVMITITVENIGTDSIQSAEAQLAVDGNPYSAAEMIPGPIAPGATTTYTFTTVANLAAAGPHTVDVVATATMAPDENTANDSLSQSVNNVPSLTPTFPFQDDFESGAGLWTSGGTNSSWELSTPFGDSIQGAASGVLAWVTGDSSFYNADENSWVSTPCLDMTNAPADSWVSMQIWWESEFSWDGANLQSSADGGTTWNLVDGFADAENWYNDGSINGAPGGFQDGWTGRNGSGSGGWVLAAHPLDPSLIGNANVRFRIAFGADGGGQDDGFAFDDFTISEAPQIDLGDTLVVCGTEMLDAANPGALYSWSTGDTTQTLMLANNTAVDIIDSMITVTVVDSFGIRGRDTVIVTIPASLPTAAASVMTPIDCNGDSTGVASVMVTGGTAPISFMWNTTPAQTTMMASSLTAGTYMVMVVDSFGCTASDSVVMTEPDALSVALDSIVTPLCAGDATGEIMISTAGGTGAYMYSWDNGDTTEDLTALPAGDYVGTITDANGCVLVSPTLTVGEPDSLTVALDALTDASCPDAADGAISITTGGGTMPYGYVWDNGSMDEDLTGLTPGDYVGTITDDNGCVLVSPTLSVGSVDSATVADFTSAFAGGAVVNFTNASSGNATSYAWDFGDGGSSMDENPSYTYTANGTYTVTLVATGPCGDSTVTQTIEMTTVGVDDGLSRFVSIYPNPSNGNFTVAFSEMNASQVTVSVYNVHGQEILNEVSDQTVGNFTTDMDISNHPEGTYLLKIEIDGNMYMKQILKH